MVVWLCSDLARLGGPISTGEATLEAVVSSGAVAWLALCVAIRPPIVPNWPRPGTLAAVIASVVALPIGLLLTPVAPESSRVGDVLLIASAGLLAWSAASLGHRFTLFPTAINLQCSGPYRFVRHPMYTSYMIGSAGIVLHIAHPIMIVAALIEAASLQVRATAEDQVLASLPGHSQYRVRTQGKFLPRFNLISAIGFYLNRYSILRNPKS